MNSLHDLVKINKSIEGNNAVKTLGLKIAFKLFIQFLKELHF